MVYKTDEQKENFKALLDETHSWPDYYRFKFIVPIDKREELMEIIKGHDIEEKESSKGNYVSVTVRVLVHSSDHIIEIYESVTIIKGIISL